MKIRSTFARDELAAAQNSLAQALEGSGADKKERQNAALLLEELSILLWENAGEESPAEMTVSTFLGRVTLTLSIRGEEYDPISQENIWDAEEENYYRRIIICANRDKLSYTRRNGRNQITVLVHESSGQRTWLTLGAMALGVAAGLVLRRMAPGSVELVDQGVLDMVKNLFLNSLKMIVGPVVFLSITTSIGSMTDLSALGRMGGKLALIYASTTLMATLTGAGMGLLVALGGKEVTAEAMGAQLTTASFSLKDTLLGIIPTNIVSPFLEGNMTQVIFLSLFFGVCLSILGERTAAVSDFLGRLNDVFLKMISLLMRFIPLVAFCSMASVTSTMGADSLLVILRMMAGILLSGFFMVAVYGLLILIFGRMSPIPFWRKLPSFWPTPLSLSSSSATMPTSIRFCSEQMGVSEKVSAFSIPLGTTVNMDGMATTIPLIAILFLREYGMALTFHALMTLVVVTFLLTVSAPGVPGSGIICISTAVVALNIPPACIGIVVGVYQFIDMLNTALNCSGDIAATVLVSRSEGLLDQEIYHRL